MDWYSGAVAILRADRSTPKWKTGVMCRFCGQISRYSFFFLKSLKRKHAGVVKKFHKLNVDSWMKLTRTRSAKNQNHGQKKKRLRL